MRDKLTVIGNPLVTASGQIPTVVGNGRPAGAGGQPEAPVDRPTSGMTERRLWFFAVLGV